jgi:hypothetical protein
MDDYYKNQYKTVFEYLKEHLATASMVSEATGISQKNICRYKSMLQESNKLWEVVKKKCKVTNREAWYLTTNPDLIPPSNQLNLFE